MGHCAKRLNSIGWPRHWDICQLLAMMCLLSTANRFVRVLLRPDDRHESKLAHFSIRKNVYRINMFRTPSILLANNNIRKQKQLDFEWSHQNKLVANCFFFKSSKKVSCSNADDYWRCFRISRHLSINHQQFSIAVA